MSGYERIEEAWPRRRMRRRIAALIKSIRAGPKSIVRQVWVVGLRRRLAPP